MRWEGTGGKRRQKCSVQSFDSQWNIEKSDEILYTPLRAARWASKERIYTLLPVIVQTYLYRRNFSKNLFSIH